MNIILDASAKLPTRAHEADAGYDLYSRNTRLVRAHHSAVFDTGVHVQLPCGTAGLLVSKSGLNTTHDITSTGLIDEGYTGSIRVKLYNHGERDYLVSEGDKISQLVIIPVCKPALAEVETFAATDRGSNGFGSSGK